MPDHNLSANRGEVNRTAMPVTLLAWKPMNKGALRGFAKVRVGKSLIINDVTVLNANGKRWAGMPGKPQVGQDGMVLRDERGKVKYTPVVEWADKGAADSFSEGVISAVEASHPGATAA